MSRFPGKKLPPHWVYVPSRREVRDLLRGLGANVRGVKFDGTGGGLSSFGTLLLGYLERRVADEGWCFFLRLSGVPKSALGNRHAELSCAALEAIRQSVSECLMLPPAEVTKPTRLLLFFSFEAEGVVSRCSVKPGDQF